MSIYRHTRSFIIAALLTGATLAPALAFAATPTKQKSHRRHHKISAASWRERKHTATKTKTQTTVTTNPTPTTVATVPTPNPTVVTVSAPSPTVAPQSPEVNAATRSLWVWGTATKIVSDAQAQNDFFVFAAAPHGDASLKLNRVFFFGDGLNLTSGAPQVRAFLQRAHNAGIAVEYLTGDSNWAQDGQGGNATARVDKVIAFNAGSASAAERFDGIHFDIEPYLLAGWSSNRAGISANYMNILRDSRAKISASGQQLALNVDIPTWYSSSVPEIWGPLTASDTPVTGATIMNYFDTASTFLYGYGGANTSGGIGPNLAKSGNLKLTFGAETMPITPTSITFNEEGSAALSSVFAQAASKFGSNAHFGGLAIHHYDTFRALQ